jgi:hypothetical protein
MSINEIDDFGKEVPTSANQDPIGPTNRILSKADHIGGIVAKKNRAYGDSFAQAGKILAILYPNGVKPDEYNDMLGIIRVLDKLFRIATQKDAFGESPWMDVAGYGILGAINDDMKKLSTPEKSEKSVDYGAMADFYNNESRKK